jgi:hypothetical protein
MTALYLLHAQHWVLQVIQKTLYMLIDLLLNMLGKPMVIPNKGSHEGNLHFITRIFRVSVRYEQPGNFTAVESLIYLFFQMLLFFGSERVMVSPMFF